jgi:hypothetical protein
MPVSQPHWNNDNNIRQIGFEGHLLGVALILNRTQHITLDWIIRSGLDGEDLLLEALLRRGFLAFRDKQGVWLGSGSHSEDIRVLQLIQGIVVEADSDCDDRIAAVSLRYKSNMQTLDAIKQIIAVPEHHKGNNGGGFTTFGPAAYLSRNWGTYRNIKWGAKLAVCPSSSQEEQICGALDIGVALLVKALPFLRVVTSLSCDGHGRHPAYVSFHFPWDAPWCKTAFNALDAQTPASLWTWGESKLEIEPANSFDDLSVLDMLNDIQTFARSLLNQKIIAFIGQARTRTLDVFGALPPSLEEFAFESRLQLQHM